MGRYVFTISPKKRKKPNYHYEGILKTHRFYIEYYSLLDGLKPEEATRIKDPYMAFPVSFVEDILSFALDLSGEIVKREKVSLAKSKLSYEKPVVLLANDVVFRRHLLFSLTASTFRKPTKLNTLRDLFGSMNANFLNVLSEIAVARYNEMKSSGNAAWHWYTLRVGRSIKVLYKLDR